MILITG